MDKRFMLAVIDSAIRHLEELGKHDAEWDAMSQAFDSIYEKELDEIRTKKRNPDPAWSYDHFLFEQDMVHGSDRIDRCVNNSEAFKSSALTRNPGKRP